MSDLKLEDVLLTGGQRQRALTDFPSDEEEMQLCLAQAHKVWKVLNQPCPHTPGDARLDCGLCMAELDRLLR